MIKYWLQALRLRTLPLALSGIFVGSSLAAYHNSFNKWICLLACLTTVLYQVLSNYANDYGDGLKGTDSDRKGEARMVGSGMISPKQMKIAIIILVVLSFLSSLLLLWIAFLPDYILYFLIFTLLSVFAIWAAISYTNGKASYGYRALGDVFVYITFGLLAVLGSYFLFTKQISWTVLLPSSAIGLLATAVLNLNNMRDIHDDKKHGKKTIPGIIGFKYAKIYHSLLIISPFILTFIYTFLETENHLTSHLYLILIVPAKLLLHKVNKTTDPTSLDSELKKTALLTLAFSLLIGIGLILSKTFS